jgi:murein DD-endopeptidase MepM/ murein hydrolase activator NlpD
MGLTATFLKRSRDLWVKRERDYKAKAAHAHQMHQQRDKQLADLTPKVVMPVRTNMATNTNGWTGPNGHDGIDLICSPNQPLVAMCRSKVVRVSASGWWGNNPQPSPGHPVSDGDGIIILECLITAGPFRPGLHLCYGHGEHATVKAGDIVEAGQVIGKAGFARAWHVHFMVNDDPPVNGLYRGVGDRDPKPYLDFAKGAA